MSWDGTELCKKCWPGVGADARQPVAAAALRECFAEVLDRHQEFETVGWDLVWGLFRGRPLASGVAVVSVKLQRNQEIQMRTLMIAGCLAAALGCSTTNEAAKPAPAAQPVVVTPAAQPSTVVVTPQAPPAKVVVVPSN